MRGAWLIGAMVTLCLSSWARMAAADTCMVSPTDKEVVSGRFGKFRGGGVENFGSANSKPHMHDGLDFSTSGASQPLYATTDGVVTFMGLRGTAGNSILIERSNGDVVAYYHMSGFASALRQGSAVKAGQYLGLSGNSPTSTLVKHLHFVYGTGRRDDARARSYSANAASDTFNPAQLPSVFNQQKGIGWKTDPSPYFCQTFRIEDGNPQDYPILGRDTKAQYSILFERAPQGSAPTGHLEPVQIAAANADTARASAGGWSTSEFASGSGSFGVLPTPPIGGYDTMSTSEMMFTEATRRFADAQWNTNVTEVDSRALLVDYTRVVGVSAYLKEAIQRKKTRVEALLALYTSQKLDRARAQAQLAQRRAQGDFVRRAVE